MGTSRAFSDRPEVRALIEFMASPEWGRAWAASPATNSFLSPNLRFDTSSYRGGQDEDRDAVRLGLGGDLREALSNGVFRFDASDLMPGPIGAFGPDGGAAAVWTGMLDWVDGVRTMDQVLADIETAWVALEADEGG